LGPLILAIAWTLGEIYHEDFSGQEVSSVSS